MAMAMPAANATIAAATTSPMICALMRNTSHHGAYMVIRAPVVDVSVIVMARSGTSGPAW